VRYPRLGWCCQACIERLRSGDLDAGVLMPELQRDATERLAAVLVKA
jgi:hypothetical protein